MLPERIGRYEVQRELGRGAMGVVYLAHDPAIGRSVAIKTVSFETGLSGQDRQEAQRRFRREAQAAGRLIHPHIVTVLDVGEIGGGDLFIAMEYIDGPTLDRFSRRGDLLEPDRVVHFVCQAAEALAFAHRHRIVHRDLKPANLMIADGDRLKVTDFGLAKDPATELTHSGTLIGTPSYMSPEQIAGRQLDGRADLFSLGVLLFELLTGSKPFPGDSISTVIYRILHEEPPDLLGTRPDLPATLAPIVRRMLHKEPELRYQTGSELARALRDHRTAAAPPAGDTTRVSPGPRPPGRPLPEAVPRRGPWKPLVLGLVALLLLGVALVAFVPRVRRKVRRVIAPQLLAGGPLRGENDGDRWLLLAADREGAVFRLEGEPVPGDKLVREASLVGRVVTASDGCLQGSRVLGGTLPTGELRIPLTEPVYSDIRVRSEPPGAAIRLDGSPTGERTPATLSLEACRPHDLELSRPGNETATLHLPAEGNWLERTARPVALAPLPDGSLRVEAAYPVQVLRDGERIGASGQEIPMPAGTHALVLGSRRHRIRLEREVEIAPGAESVLRLELPPLGEVRINAHPGNAVILVDGLDAGPPPVLLSLAAGQHEIACRWNVGVPRAARRQIRVEAGGDNPAVNFRQRR